MAEEASGTGHSSDVAVDDALIAEEERLFGEGVREGRAFGAARAAGEVRARGVSKGYELGLEFGFYRGCVKQLQELRMQMKTQPPVPQTRREAEITQICKRLDRPTVSAVLESLEGFINSFQVTRPIDEAAHEELLKIRSRFKVLESRLGIVLDITPDLHSALAANSDIIPHSASPSVQF